MAANDPGPDVPTATGTLQGVAPFIWNGTTWIAQAAGNQAAQIQLTPTVQAAAYVAGTVIGGLLTFAGAARILGGTGLVQAASCCFASGVVPSLDLVLFSASPSGSTVTDRTALAVVAADLAKVIGVIHCNDGILLGAASPSVMQGQQQAVPFDCVVGSSTIYGALVVRSTTVTLGSTTDATINLFVLQS